MPAAAAPLPGATLLQIPARPPPANQTRPRAARRRFWQAAGGRGRAAASGQAPRRRRRRARIPASPRSPAPAICALWPRRKPRVSWLAVDALSGAIGEIASLVVLYPLDSLKAGRCARPARHFPRAWPPAAAGCRPAACLSRLCLMSAFTALRGSRRRMRTFLPSHLVAVPACRARPLLPTPPPLPSPPAWSPAGAVPGARHQRGGGGGRAARAGVQRPRRAPAVRRLRHRRRLLRRHRRHLPPGLLLSQAAGRSSHGRAAAAAVGGGVAAAWRRARCRRRRRPAGRQQRRRAAAAEPSGGDAGGRGRVAGGFGVRGPHGDVQAAHAGGSLVAVPGSLLWIHVDG